MQLITWEENYIKSLHSEKNTFREKPVAKYDEQNNEIARYNSISEAEKRFSQIMHTPSKAVITSFAEVGMDVDKPEDLKLIEKYLSK